MPFGILRRARRRIDGAAHPARARAVLTLWGLFAVGTLAFAVLDVLSAAVSLSYWQLWWVVVVLLAATAAVFGGE